ncbi:Putative aminopeptidase [Komagataella phaffii CBS 7435]|uniref:Peptide hydrolase n=2 Tax=Komagataella phaffii TaxID=460519 RepID=C4QWD7_KOMPG|nr:uncharacterized protein PAS_chr1-1_0194 [Komagataella phaffii GS115]AOA60637.1 GQ67_02773T0 [Komagataella phaffii]CAH2446230.1 Putative aminopeptidase [Komagataella phaffii CBS 7435]AOA65711.1 GQ68_02475T0 [Komagataella phaffii GS115]CAY67560.1 Putative protein of unknown function [Komagataella phaffii GS115]CCA36656.1 Putative aminopeptidase [Komagataella phaffii CBS 7435]
MVKLISIIALVQLVSATIVPWNLQNVLSDVHHPSLHLLDYIQSLKNEVMFDGDDRRIIKLGPQEYRIITEKEKYQLKTEGISFIDVTYQHGDNVELLYSSAPVTVPDYLYPSNDTFHFKQVNSLIGEIDIGRMQAFLGRFSSFFTRFYKSDKGLQSSIWLQGELVQLALKDPSRFNVTTVEHPWKQNSAIFTIYGENVDPSKGKGDIVVVGCHQDSINLLFPNILRAPGADDDGSGVTSNLEALRIIVESGLKFHNTVEFHFYSAEEGGLLGSQQIFSSYRAAEETVVAMLQQDMTGYIQKALDHGESDHFGLITDHTNANLNSFLALLIDAYTSIPYKETECGYACSDHSSALEHGYPSAMVFESSFAYTNPFIHSTQDTIDKINFPHMAEHVKLVLGYVVELGLEHFR